MQQPGYFRVSLGYMLLTLVLVAPVLPYFASAIIGGQVAEGDGWQNVWNLWWVQHALATGQNPLYTALLYYPTGTDLALQTLNLSNGLLAAPITWLFGPIAGYNAIMLLAFVLTGLGGYALALRVAGNRLAAFVGGAVLTFSPYHLTKLYDGQLELIALQWLPLYALFLLRAVEDSRWRDAILAGLFLALIGYTSWYYLLFVALYSLVFGLVWLLWPPHAQARRGRMLRQMFAGAVIAFLLLLPLLLPALTTLRTNRAGIAPDPFSPMKILHSADLVDFWLPSALHPLWGPAVTAYGTSIHPIISAWNIAPGYVALVLAGLAALLRWRVAWRWWLLTLVAFVLALGPVLQVGGHTTGIPLPYALVALLPGADIANRPSHFVVLAVVLLAPLSALGLATVMQYFSGNLPTRSNHTPTDSPLVVGAGWGVRAGRSGPEQHGLNTRTLLVVSLVAGLLLLELLPPAWPLQRMLVHPIYTELARESGPLLILPPQLERSNPLQAQIIHQRPIVGGFVSRTPPYPFVHQTPGVQELWGMQADGRVPFGEQPDDALVALNATGLHQIVIHDHLLEPDQRQAVDAALTRIMPGVQPRFHDEQVRVYQVPEVELHPYLGFGSGWYPLEQQGERRWRWMQAEGQLFVTNPLDSPQVVHLTLRAESYQEARMVQLSIEGSHVRAWPVEPGLSSISVQLIVPPGTTPLVLSTTTTAEQSQSSRQLSIVIVEAQLR